MRAKLAILGWPLLLHWEERSVLFAVLFIDKPGQGALRAEHPAGHQMLTRTWEAASAELYYPVSASIGT